MLTNLSKIKRETLISQIDSLIEKYEADEDAVKVLNNIVVELFDKKYGINWERHLEFVDDVLKDNIPVFTEDSEKEISKLDGKINFLIEGDNLHSLYLLDRTHRGAIDLIYIDPPYNTKNKDFIYDDKRIGEDDDYRHSKWLSFMSERLEIAKRLLSQEGVIFIHIDDNELAQLKMLCDEIFGDSNYLNIISVNMKNIAGVSGGGEDKRFKKNCEYILIYAKNYGMMPQFNGAYEYIELSELIENYEKEGKSWKYTSVLVDAGEKEYVGSTVTGDGEEIKVYLRKNPVIKSIKRLAKEDGITEKEAYRKYGTRIFQTTNAQSSIRIRVMDYRHELGLTEDLLSIEYVPRSGRNKGKVYEQFYKGDKCRLFAWLKDTSEEIDGILYKKELQGTYWDMTPYMKNVAKEGDVDLPSGKKPLDLLKRIISLYPATDITVLDFFAGSGTTGHAVLAQNAEDGGTRKFIMCTNNENDICEKITYKRMKSVIEGYGTIDGLPANLKYYKTDKVARDEEFLEDALMDHIIEMIQLENFVKVDGNEYIVLLTDEDLDVYMEKFDSLDTKVIYYEATILLSAEMKGKFKDKGIELFKIPDYYFAKEVQR